MELYKVGKAMKMEFPEYEYALPGLPIGKVGILHSIGGVGKSFWAMQACFQTVAAGSCDFQFKAISKNPAPVGGKAVYISFEDEWNDFGRRVKAFHNSFEDDDKRAWVEDIGEELFDFIFVNSAIFRRGEDGDIEFTKAFDPLKDYFENIKESRRRVNLIIFDTLSRMHYLDENSNSDMAALLSWFERFARSMGAAVLILHHDNKLSMNGNVKEERGNTAAIRGASALGANVRWHASMRTMTPSEAEDYGINEDYRKFFIRIELDKTSYSPPIPGAWLERVKGGALKAIGEIGVNQDV